MSAVHMVQYSACARRVAPSNCTFDIPCSCTALFAADSLPLSSLLAGEALSRVGRSVGNLTLRPPCRPRGCLRSPQRPGCAPRVEGEESHGIPVLLKRESSSRVYPEKGKEAPEDCREREGWRTSPSLMPGSGDCWPSRRSLSPCGSTSPKWLRGAQGPNGREQSLCLSTTRAIRAGGDLGWTVRLNWIWVGSAPPATA